MQAKVAGVHAEVVHMAEETEQVGFRLPKSLVKKLDARAKEMGVAALGMVYTRTDVVRIILTQGLGGDSPQRKARRGR